MEMIVMTGHGTYARYRPVIEKHFPDHWMRLENADQPGRSSLVIAGLEILYRDVIAIDP